MYLELHHLKKSFDGRPVVTDLSLTLDKGQLLCILGASGCGKTTTLNMIGGFLTPDSGQVLLDGRDITSLPPERRPVTTVFQSYGLFPHMTVLENVIYGLKFRGVKKAAARKQGMAWLNMVGLEDHAHAMSDTLSGGQQQRVSIARALALNPKVLFFDEPTSALDPELTGEILRVIRDLASKDVTMVIVTHEIDFARNVADRIIFMADGVVLEDGTPEEVLDNPKNEKTRHFLNKLIEN